MIRKYPYLLAGAASLLVLTAAFAPGRPPRPSGGAAALTATLSEWKIDLSSATIAAGRVTFTATNAGSIPHALEVEGNGLEQKTPLIQPGETATLSLTLKPGAYEIYCPVGEDSHKKLGMETHLKVEGEKPAASKYSSVEIEQPGARAPRIQAIQVSGGGPVIQILPGPFPFPDSVAPVLSAFGDERAMLEKQESNGPYSDKVATTSGTFRFTAWDLGAVRDSIDGVAEFATKDGARWKLVLDRVQTTDLPHHPRFGGVIMGLYYHGMTTVHTPLVPTINSAVALWAIGHLYRNGGLVTDNAQVHVMLLSRTRRPGDFALSCWDCSKNKIEELQLQVTPAKGEPTFDAPGGFLFVNWEKSRGHRTS
jgi:plastocyanin